MNENDRKYLAELEKTCVEKMVADPSELNELRMIVSQFRIAELTVSVFFLQNIEN